MNKSFLLHKNILNGTLFTTIIGMYVYVHIQNIAYYLNNNL